MDELTEHTDSLLFQIIQTTFSFAYHLHTKSIRMILKKLNSIDSKLKSWMLVLFKKE